MDAGRSAERRYCSHLASSPAAPPNSGTQCGGHTHDVVLRLKVNQRNVPGIDNAYLAMDTEEGVEVVWNEVMFSERKNFKLQEVGTVRAQSGSQAIRKSSF